MKNYLNKKIFALIGACLFTSAMPITLSEVSEKNIALISFKDFITILETKHEDESNVAQVLANYITKDNVLDVRKAMWDDSFKTMFKNRGQAHTNRIIELLKADKSCAALITKNVADKTNVYDLCDIIDCILDADSSLAKVYADLIDETNIKKTMSVKIIEKILGKDCSLAATIIKNAIPEINFKEINFDDFFRSYIPRIMYELMDADPSVRKTFAQWKGFIEFEKAYEKYLKDNPPATWDDVYKHFDDIRSGEGNMPSINIPTISNDDAYKTLGLSENASLREIKTAYKKLSMQYHPDHNKNKSESEQKEAEKKMIEINAAYELLGRRSKL